MKKIVLSLTLIILVGALAGCSNSDNNNYIDETASKKEIKVNPNCEKLAAELEKICTEDNLNNLNFEKLQQCDWITQDKDYFIENCEDESAMNIMTLLFSFRSDGVDDKTIFYNKMKDFCENSKIGDLTIKEYSFCLKEFGDIESCDKE